GVTSALIAFAALLGVSGLMAQSQDKQKNITKVAWPETAPYNAAILAFDAALTRAAWDMGFRQRLIKSPDSAKEAVAEEGHINIPASKAIVFMRRSHQSQTRPNMLQQSKALISLLVCSRSRNLMKISTYFICRPSRRTTKQSTTGTKTISCVATTTGRGNKL